MAFLLLGRPRRGRPWPETNLVLFEHLLFQLLNVLRTPSSNSRGKGGQSSNIRPIVASARAVTIKRDYFPYFTAGRPLTITALSLFGTNPTKHHAIGDAGTATTDLSNNGKFIVTAPPDAAGSTQVLVRKAGTQAFLVVQYSLG